MSQQPERKSLFQMFAEMSNDSRSRASTSLEQIVEPTTHHRRPLHDVVICLSGLTSEAKEKIHALVEKLGGRYTRDFNLDKNTHLVVEVPQGAKYHLAASHSRMCIVTPSWLEECQRQGIRVDEGLFPVMGGSRKTLPPSIQPSHCHIFDILLKETHIQRSLFDYHQFYLMGFEDAPEVKKRVGRVIRRGGGTIHWELSDDVTILVIHDSCHDALRKAALMISTQHPNLPPMVSPRWIVDSYRKKTLVSTTKYRPLRQNVASAQTVITKSSKTTTHPVQRTDSLSSIVLRGSLFALARIAPPENVVDFDSKEQEASIRAHGGQILTRTLVDAMVMDAKHGTSRKKCYVVCWGGAPQLEHHPLLSQLKRNNACDLVLVTPIWLASCIAFQKLVVPGRIPEFFIPQPWPFYNLKGANLRVSLTGFIGTEKLALVQAMKACNVQFLKEMTSRTTHLVCKEKANGLKLKKALEWGIRIVSMDWMHFILRHGYSEDDGPDNRFSVKA